MTDSRLVYMYLPQNLLSQTVFNKILIFFSMFIALVNIKSLLFIGGTDDSIMNYTWSLPSCYLASNIDMNAQLMPNKISGVKLLCFNVKSAQCASETHFICKTQAICSSKTVMTPPSTSNTEKHEPSLISIQHQTDSSYLAFKSLTSATSDESVLWVHVFQDPAVYLIYSSH